MESAPAQATDLTRTQQRVVVARGNVLVMAGAGTGKTKTLVERCLDCLERDGAQIDELLIVTFTEAAAAEMRERLRHAMETRLQAESETESSATVSTPGIVRWAEQLARFDLAHIGTLHSFCLKLVREHFYDLGLDPRLAILGEGEARQLANATLDEQFAAHYAGHDDFSLAVQTLIQVHGTGRDDSIRRLILQLHHYSQARPDAAGWLARQREKFSATEPADWQRWFVEAIAGWRGEWLPVLENLKRDNEKAAELAGLLSRLDDQNDESDSTTLQNTWRTATSDILEQIVAADGNWPARRKIILRDPIKGIFDEAEFLHSLAAVKDGVDPLVEDWSWIRGHMETLLRLAEEFAARLAEQKHANGVLDFHDLEQFALKLLWDFSTGQPTAVATGWRNKLKFIFVDEYQDINAAQDKIIQGLSRDDAAANRFLVGDVKQSIYRFRLADPKIFRDYAQTWHRPAGETIPLSENFRSREGLLHLVNSICQMVMRPEVGGVAYDADAALKFGSPESRASLSMAQDTEPCAELWLRFKNGRKEDADELAGLDDAQSEAQLVARRLQKFVADQRQIFDVSLKAFRPVAWRDIAILLRSPRGRSEIFAKEFERAGIPLAVVRGGFYESAEILDLLSLLQLLDNPLQDVPCIAVLRSPLVGLSLNQLAEIRLAAPGKHFWTALNRSVELGINEAAASAKIARFLKRFSQWRRLAKLVSLSQCLDEVLAETFYADWLRGQPRGAQRAANVAGLLQLARQFDQFQRQGLFRFLKFIEAQQEAGAEPDVASDITENAVRLMSIHQSKGLEFPVVVLADLSKRFNEQDLRGEIIFDEKFGLCPKVKPPPVGRRYPSLTHWLAQRHQKHELRGEELRLLYVALTRARDHLILTAGISEKNWGEKWRKAQPVTIRAIGEANCFADWLSLWFSHQAPVAAAENQSSREGEFKNLRWQIVADADLEKGLLSSAPPGQLASPADGALVAGHDDLSQLPARLNWAYPHQNATQRKAKSSVTALRREAEELNDEAEPLFSERGPVHRLKPAGGARKLTAAEAGAAHHKFLQQVALEKLDDLPAEAERLLRERYLTADERAALDVRALSAFWASALGRKIRAHAQEVRRELPFTARFSPAELVEITGAKPETGLAQEYVIVQGVADLVVLQPHEIWLVDFKTDEIGARELPEKIKAYRPQLLLYASALEKIFARKVTLRALHFLATNHTEEL